MADRYDLDVAAVYRALTYYHEHPGEMADVRRRRERLEQEAVEEGAERLSDLGDGVDVG